MYSTVPETDLLKPQAKTLPDAVTAAEWKPPPASDTTDSPNCCCTYIEIDITRSVDSAESNRSTCARQSGTSERCCFKRSVHVHLRVRKSSVYLRIQLSQHAR
jgi:hypothetical protein